MNVLRALDENLRAQDGPGSSSGASSITARANLAALSSVEEILSELVKEATAHEARTDGLMKFAVSRRMQGLVADATAQVCACMYCVHFCTCNTLLCSIVHIRD
jgi:hypothetical protein